MIFNFCDTTEALHRTQQNKHRTTNVKISAQSGAAYQLNQTIAFGGTELSDSLSDG